MARTKKRIILTLAVGCLLSCLVCCLLVPSVQKVRDGGWQRSQSNLRQIGLALQNYHETYGKLPPAVVTSKDGRPLYSWRVLILPFLEESNFYKAFKLDEPWDSPHNQKLLEVMPQIYASDFESQTSHSTHYQVFVGPGTAFERAGLTWQDFPDGRSGTILVVEASEAVPWTKPVDLEYSPDKPVPPLGGVFNRHVYVLGYQVGSKPCFNAVFADGSARFISNETDEQTLRSLITRNGGEKVDWSKVK